MENLAQLTIPSRRAMLLTGFGVFAVFVLLGSLIRADKITSVAVEALTLEPIETVGSAGETVVVYESSFSDRALSSLGAFGELLLGVLGTLAAWSFRVLQFLAARLDNVLNQDIPPEGQILDAEWDALLGMLAKAVEAGDASKVEALCNMMYGAEFIECSQLTQPEEQYDAPEQK